VATDIARISYDPARKYIDTVPQQGRVSLEAEENEQHTIDDVERLKELLDLVGPAGTPDGGYAVSYSGAGSPEIGTGIMYVGGLRVENGTAFKYSEQPDWLDYEGDPNYTAPVGDGTAKEHVVLVLIEVDVTATEDPALREAALGGPDGAARRKILQRIYLNKTDATTCAGATETDKTVWAHDGLTFDPSTMRLDSDSRLLVTWDGTPPKADPCEPTVAGGYLGADNQAIMVKICAVDQAAGTFDFVWGWDNGSNLYQVTADRSANPVLTLGRAPVDSYHNPQIGQPVEVLRSAAELISTDGVIEGYVASLTGEVANLTAPYDPDLKQITFPATLPTPYQDSTETPQLYLRVWQELHQNVTPGTAVTLTGTGIQVTISLEDAQIFAHQAESGRKKTGFVHLGDYWTIGVRPSTPNTVLPDRLLRQPQPPDGPRMWACPLAVIEWAAEKFTVLADCRVPFPSLTSIKENGGGCCTVSAAPTDAANLQKILDKAAAGRTMGDVSQRVTVCLSPGRYELTAPLRLTERHSQLHLEGCGDGAVVTIASGQESAFGDGMVLLLGAKDVKFSGITFQPLPVDTGIGRSRKAAATSDMRSIDAKLTALNKDRRIGIVLRPVDCTGIVVENCVFDLEPTMNPTSTTTTSKPTTDSGSDADSNADTLSSTRLIGLNEAYFAVGIFLNGVNKAISVTSCHFTGTAISSSNLTQAVTIGIVASPTLVRAGDTTTGKALSTVGSRVTAELEGLRVADSTFSSLSAAAVAFAALGGTVIEDNTVRDCYIGFGFLALDTPTDLDLTGNYQAGNIDQNTMDGYNNAVTSLVLDPTLLFTYAFARAYPLPADYQPAATEVQNADNATSDVTPATWTTQLVKELTTGKYVAAYPASSSQTSAPATQSTSQDTNQVADAQQNSAGENPATWTPPAPDELDNAPQTTDQITAQSTTHEDEDEATVTFGTGAANHTELVSGGGTANNTVRAAALSVIDYDRQLPYPASTAVFKLRFHDNRVECAIPDVYSNTGVSSVYARTGPALTIWVANQPQDSSGGALYTARVVKNLASVIVSSNEMLANGTGPVAVIVLADVVTVTGNQVLRQDEDQDSIAVLAVRQGVAVTGNVLYGKPLIPDPAKWTPVNTVVY